MKNIIILAAALMAALFTASCTKELPVWDDPSCEIEETVLEGSVSSYASFELPESFGKGGVICQKARYCADGTLAVRLWKVEEGCAKPLAVLTTHLSKGDAGENRAYVDMSMNPWAERFITENGLGEIADSAAIRDGKICLLVRFNTGRFRI